MKRRLALTWMLALVYAGCDGDPTEPELGSPDPADHPSAGVVQVGENQFAVDFNAYEADERLWEADWTRIARSSPTDIEPDLGDWRTRDGDPSFTGRVAALLDPPLSGLHRIALQWDALPILEPPLEILARLWLPPEENLPRVGIAWFIPEPDETGRLNGFAIVRNARGLNNGFFLRVLHSNTRASTWWQKASLEDGFNAGGWTWIRVRHTVEGKAGTVRFRAWQGELEDEPTGWDFDGTANYFGPRDKLGTSGKAGFYVSGSPGMEGVIPLWGAFTVGINGAPAPPPPSGCDEVEISVAQADGPNASGSFTSRQGENEISLVADISPERLAEDLAWRLEPSPDHDVPIVLPTEFPTGSPASFTVPSQDVQRWYRHVLRDVDQCRQEGRSDCAPDLKVRSLSFETRASAADCEIAYDSEPEQTTQDEIDTARQEYIDFGRARTPARAALGTRSSANFSPRELNRTGHYRVYMSDDALLTGLEELRRAVARKVELIGIGFRGLVVTSGYRNPVHHTVHVESSDDESWHQYGFAADLRISNHEPEIPRLDFFELVREAADEVGACFLPYRQPIHAHVDWRPACPDTW